MKKRFLLWLMQTRLYTYLLLHVIPYVRFTTYYTSLRGWKYLRGYRLLKPGDIILTLDRKKLTTLLIPGEFSHAALCVGKDCDFEVAEMTHTNYTMSTFFDICKESDRVAVIRCRDWDPAYTQKVIEKCKSFKDAKYDVGFYLDIRALYCSELVFQSDFQYRLQCNLTDLEGLGRPYISPTGLWNAYAKGRNADLVWDSDKELK